MYRQLSYSMSIHHVETYSILLYSQEPGEQGPIDGIGIGRLAVEESGVKSKSASIGTNPIIEANSMDIYHVGMFLIPLCSWEATEQCPGNRNGIGCQVVEQSRFECWDRQKLARVPRHFLF